MATKTTLNVSLRQNLQDFLDISRVTQRALIDKKTTSTSFRVLLKIRSSVVVRSDLHASSRTTSKRVFRVYAANTAKSTRGKEECAPRVQFTNTMTSFSRFIFLEM